MGKVRVRKETGKLYLDFMYAGHRCREQTALVDTAANRKKVESVLQKIEAKILLGTFDYGEQFPNSRNIRKFDVDNPSRFDTQHRSGQGHSARSSTPLFEDFA